MVTKIMGVTVFVQKIISLHPTEYKFISLQKALEDYSRYLFTVNDYKKQETAKGFKTWCKTEI